MDRLPPPAAPAFDDLPPRRGAATGARCDLAVRLRTVTPILGGGYRAGELDDVDIIRVPTVRGHLRFWWRALVAGRFASSRALYDAECRLWGGAGGGAEKAPALRSSVDVRVEVTSAGSTDGSDIAPNTVGGYALFPARSEQLRRRLGVAFTLTIAAPSAEIATVRDAVKCWILFGGYGGRTRRGLGSLTVVGPEVSTWLPRSSEPLREEFARLFGDDLFAAPGDATQTPALAGAVVVALGGAHTNGIDVWAAAVDTLRKFRQGVGPHAGAAAGTRAVPWAREPGGHNDPARPSISNWPEADKMRHLAGRTVAHPPRHNATPWWPRAGFGLPILGRFQTSRRGGGAPYWEPPPFTLKWREAVAGAGYRVRERLASPLILKALPLADGRFVAIALWLHRAWPNGQVVLQFDGPPVAGSAASFDRAAPPGDTPRFAPLVGMRTLRTAFFAWLTSDPHAVVAGGVP